MAIVSRWITSTILAVGVGLVALSPVPALAQSGDLTRVLVDVADVALRGGTPYYRYGNYGHDDRLITSHDRHGRPIYYRNVRRGYQNVAPHGYVAPHGNAYGYQGYGPNQQVRCNKHGKCKTTAYGRNGHGGRGYDNRYNNRYDNRYSYDRRDRRGDDDHDDD